MCGMDQSNAKNGEWSLVDDTITQLLIWTRVLPKDRHIDTAEQFR